MRKPNGETMDADVLKREATAWVVRLSSGEATRNDLQDLRSWCQRSPSHAAAFDRARSLWQALGPAGELYLGHDGATAGARPGRVGSGRAGVSRRGILVGALATAAAVPMVVVPPWHLWLSAAEVMADYHTRVGEQRRIALADGAVLELNTASALNVDPRDGGDRLELLSGEVAVTTASDQPRPILVRVGGGEVSARAASFTVRHGADETRVTCLAGTVVIRCGGGDASLGPGQQIELGGQRLGPAVAVDTTAVAAWRQNMLIFHNEPLVRVIAEVNRYRPGRIVLLRTDLAERLVSARFKLDRLDDVVTQIRQVFTVEVRTLPGGIVVLT